MTSRIEQDGLIVLAMIKGQEKYLLLYEPAQANEAIRTLGRWASDPQLSFTWYDAAAATRESSSAHGRRSKRTDNALHVSTFDGVGWRAYEVSPIEQVQGDTQSDAGTAGARAR